MRQSGKISWTQFARRYRKELFLGGPIDKRSRTIKNHGQKFTLQLIKRLARRGQRRAALPFRRGSNAVPQARAAGVDSQ
jgi:hypothetical protein